MEYISEQTDEEVIIYCMKMTSVARISAGIIYSKA
jgi:hypothetical protein